MKLLARLTILNRLHALVLTSALSLALAPSFASAQGVNANASLDDPASSARERRAQAYAKLMEGQRHYAAARSGGTTLEALRLAQAALRRAAELDPTLSEAHTALAEIAFFFLNDIPQAEREAETAIRIDRNNFGAHRVLSRVHTLKSNLSEGTVDRAAADRAVAVLREVVRLRAGDAEAWALLGDFYLASGRAAEAVDAYRRWASSPAPVDVRFYQIVTKGRELTPDAAHARLAEALLQLGRAEEAVAAASRALSIEPENPTHLDLLERASAQLARAYADDSRFEDAAKIYEDVLRARGIGDRPLTNPREKQFAARVLGGIVGLRRQAGHSAEASAAVRRMRQLLGEGDPATDVHVVDLLRDQGQKKEALEAATAARRRHPEDARLIYREATLLAESGRVEEAMGLYRARLKGVPGDYNEYIAIASVMINAGRGKEAVEAARKALELAPSDQQELTVQALLLLSSAQDRAGDFKGSEDSLRQVLVKDPDNTTALNNLGYFLTERNERLDEALTMIQRAVKAEPTNASFIDSLGWIYFKLGKLEEAERNLSDAARRNPNSATVQEHLGDLFHRLGKSEQARAAWQKALSLSPETADSDRIKAKLNSQAK